MMLPLCMTGQETLTLEQCREMAIRNNKDLDQARTKVEMAGYDRKIARANYFPNISATAAYMYNEKNLALISDEMSGKLTGAGAALQGKVNEKVTAVVEALGKIPGGSDIMQSPIFQSITAALSKGEINNLKRGWREMDLPSYITRILVQSIQAYHRREYALTVSALTTLWEGIIQDKVNDKSYRISKRTRENLAKLIEENEFDKIISSFCEEFIFYICKKPEDVKPDVPGRHGIAHCWYEAYPSRKVALNAILFTDFLLKLRPLEK